MHESEIQIVRPAGMPGNDLHGPLSCAKVLFQFLKRPDGQLVVFRQRGQKTVSAVNAKPDCISGEEILIIDKIDHVAPGVAGNEDTLDLDIADVNNLPVLQKHLLIIHFDKRKLIKPVDHLPAGFAGKIAIFDLPDIYCRILKQQITVAFRSANVIGILMCDKDLLNGCRTGSRLGLQSPPCP